MKFWGKNTGFLVCVWEKVVGGICFEPFKGLTELKALILLSSYDATIKFKRDLRRFIDTHEQYAIA